MRFRSPCQAHRPRSCSGFAFPKSAGRLLQHVAVEFLRGLGRASAILLCSANAPRYHPRVFTPRRSFYFTTIAAALIALATPLAGQEDASAPTGSAAPEASPSPAQLPEGIDRMLDGLVKTPADIAERIVFFPAGWSAVADYPVIATPWVLYLLVGSGIFFTLYFGFINISGFPVALKTIRGKYSSMSDPGEISHFQALTAAVSGTVGLGNIAGVAIAVSLGGPGATFWMIVCGLIGMSTKFCEVTLGVRYRDIGADGKIYGGSMYTLRKGFAERGWPTWGKVLAVVFAISCLGGAFGAVACSRSIRRSRSWSASRAAREVSGSARLDVRRCDGVPHCLVIIGGIKSIARVTGKLVPLCASFTC
jgi:AGCS family alanine or glycine:cation symporter